MQTLIAFLTPFIFTARDPSASGPRQSWIRRLRHDDAAQPRRQHEYNPYRFLVSGCGDDSGRSS
jgi:hypothetical protein